MKNNAITILLVALVGISFVVGRYSRSTPSKAAGVKDRKILYYQDPMHPAYKSDKPGIAPDCGMELVPVYADGGPANSTSVSSQPKGTVIITPEKQQLIGVHIGTAVETSGTRNVRTVGRVVPDEARVYRVISPLDGVTEGVAAYATGDLIKKDDLLLGINNPEFVALEQSYLSALNIQNRGKLVSGGPVQAQNDRNLDLAVASMRNVWISDQQLKDLKSTRKSSQVLEIYSPVTGCVLARNVSPGQTITRSAELYRIADLSHVWILADLFEGEAGSLRPGQTVHVSFPGSGRTYSAKVSNALPQIDPGTRTFKVRLELANPGYVLRPDMFVDIEFTTKLPAGIAVPRDAVMDSGLRKTVFVDRGNGFFEPRVVRTGWQTDDLVQIVEGLLPGEHIVVSGTFLVDSESRLKGATANMTLAAVNDPVCGMQIDPDKATAAGLKADHHGKTYYFCSLECKRKFEKQPEKYINAPEKQSSGAEKKT